MAAQATHKESLLEPEEEEPPDILDLELEYTLEESLGTMELQDKEGHQEMV